MQLDAHIMIVEDQAPMRRILEQYLLVMGFKNIAIAVNGKDALSKISDAHYDIVFVDWDMPEMNGIEFVKACKERDINQPEFVMLTGRREPRDIHVAKECDIKWYIAKPVSKKLLEERLTVIFSTKKPSE